MNFQNKTKEELILDLTELQQKYDSLKESNDIDTAERKRAEEKIKKSEAQYANALDMAKLGPWEYDVASDTFTFNDHFYAVFRTTVEREGGYTMTSAQYVRRFVHADDGILVGIETRKAIETADPNFSRKLEHRIIYADGEAGYILVYFFIIKDAQGCTVKTYGVNQDITERRLAEEKVREKDIQFRKLSANVPDLIFQFTRRPDGTYCVPIASEGIKNIFGCSPEEVLDDFTPIGRVIYPDDAARVISDIEYSAEHLTYFTCEFRVQIPGKEIQWIFSRSSPEKLPDGSVTWYGFNADITERKRAEEWLTEKEARYRRLVEGSPDIVYTFSNKRGGVYYSPRVEQVLGYSSEHLYSHPSLWNESIHPDDRHRIGGIIRDSDKGKFFEIEYRILDAKGNWLWLSDRSIGHHIVDDEVMIEGVATDITGRKRAEGELKQLSARLSLAVRAGGVGIWDYDIVHNSLLWDDQMFALYGINKNDFGGVLDAWRSGLHPEDVARGEAELQMAIRGEKEFDSVFRVGWPDGSIHTIRALGSVQRNADGQPVRMIGTNWDITDQRKAENELILAKEHAEESDRLKSAFLANMSHEIRTPMNGILGFAELLKEPELTGEEQKKYIDIIERSGIRMLNIINDIISISKVESGQMEVSLSETNINDQIEYLCTFFKPEAAQNGVQLSFSCALPAKEATLTTDREKVYAILTNLIKNAIKFTHRGSIEAGYFVETVGADNYLPLQYVFYVKDTGIGVSPKQKEFIFERFRQGTDSLSRNYEGAGLGLSISKAYVEMLGGKIWVESEMGKGSTFYFTLSAMLNREKK